VSAVESGSLGYFGRAMVNAPIVTDKLAVRVVGYYEKKPGWINNVRYGTTDVNDSSSWASAACWAIRPMMPPAWC
jgi:outer membrane receptor protein involved in Fe transport